MNPELGLCVFFPTSVFLLLSSVGFFKGYFLYNKLEFEGATVFFFPASVLVFLAYCFMGYLLLTFFLELGLSNFGV